MRVQGINNSYIQSKYSLRNSGNNGDVQQTQYPQSPSFKGVKSNFVGFVKSVSDRFSDFISEKYAKYYAEKMYNQEFLYKISDWLRKFPGKTTAHMATLGSLITSGVYVERTLSNKDLDNDKKKTLAINQGLCFLVPTIGAYWVDHLLKNNIKDKEYRYSGRQLAKINKKISTMSEKEIEKFNARMGDRLKGFGTLATLATFTFIYRYATPVLITPIANAIGNYVNERRAARIAAEEQDTGNEVKLNTTAEKETKTAA